jgi:hypothetical protein
MHKYHSHNSNTIIRQHIVVMAQGPKDTNPTKYKDNDKPTMSQIPEHLN